MKEKGLSRACTWLIYARALNRVCVIHLPHGASGKCSSKHSLVPAPYLALIIVASPWARRLNSYLKPAAIPAD